MQNSSEEAREARKPVSHVIDQALQCYEQGKELSGVQYISGTQYKRVMEKAIAEFEELFGIVKIYHDPTNPFFFRRPNILPDAHEYCGLAHLKLSYERSIDNPEFHLKKSIENLLSASYYRSKISRKDAQSTPRWEEIKSLCENYIEKYKQGETKEAPKAFFSRLISDCFNELIDVNASVGKIKGAIMELEVRDLECELDNLTHEILAFYARSYEYRGYSYNQVANFYADEYALEKARNTFYKAKRDLERACNIYKLTQWNMSETDNTISAIKNIIQEVEQKLEEVEQKIKQELENAKRQNALREPTQRFRSGFLRDFVGFFLSWMASLCSFFRAVILFANMLNTWLREFKSKDQ